MKILLVEDEEDANRYFRLALKAEGYDVTGVLSGQDALHALTEGSFDLMLLDSRMSGLDGIETGRKVRETLPADKLPICMITASMDVEKVVAAFQVGANGYIVKPFDIDELLSKIHELTDS